MGKLSTGFTGSTTRSLDELEREIEYRLGQMRAEAFAEVVHPSTVKGTGPYAQAHDDTSSADSTSSLAAAGNAKDQEELDMIDEIEDKFQKPIKKPSAQFPGSKLSASDNAGFDSHQTDPAKLEKKMTKENESVAQRVAQKAGVTPKSMFDSAGMVKIDFGSEQEAQKFASAAQGIPGVSGDARVKGNIVYLPVNVHSKGLSSSDSFDKVGDQIDKRLKRLAADQKGIVSSGTQNKIDWRVVFTGNQYEPEANYRFRGKGPQKWGIAGYTSSFKTKEQAESAAKAFCNSLDPYVHGK